MYWRSSFQKYSLNMQIVWFCDILNRGACSAPQALNFSFYTMVVNIHILTIGQYSSLVRTFVFATKQTLFLKVDRAGKHVSFFSA